MKKPSCKIELWIHAICVAALALIVLVWVLKVAPPFQPLIEIATALGTLAAAFFAYRSASAAKGSSEQARRQVEAQLAFSAPSFRGSTLRATGYIDGTGEVIYELVLARTGGDARDPALYADGLRRRDLSTPK